MGMPDTSIAVDLGFAALADPVRRAIIAHLSRGPATVNEIAEPFEISLQAVSKHIQVLEHAAWSPAPGRPSAARCTSTPRRSKR